MSKDEMIKERHSKKTMVDKLNSVDNSVKASSMRGRIIARDSETGEILKEEENLVLMRTRVWVFEQLFKTNPPTNYAPPAVINNTRQIVLMSVGSGGADINASAFSPYVPTFSDTELGERVPFIIVDPDKDNDASQKPNPSVVTELTEAQKKIYYLPKKNPDGTIYYYGKRPKGATDVLPYGTSKGWKIDSHTGEVSFSMTYNIDKEDCRGFLINEIGLWLGTFDKKTNSYKNVELATRLTFDTEPFSSLTKSIEIEYIMYVI